MKGSKGNTGNNQNWKGFADISLSEAEKAAIREAEKTFSDWESVLYVFVEQRYRVTLSYDTYNNCFTVSLTGLAGSANEGYTLTARGDTLVKALLAARAKCEKVDWGTWKSHQNDPLDIQ